MCVFESLALPQSQIHGILSGLLFPERVCIYASAAPPNSLSSIVPSVLQGGGSGAPVLLNLNENFIECAKELGPPSSSSSLSNNEGLRICVLLVVVVSIEGQTAGKNTHKTVKGSGGLKDGGLNEVS